MRRNRDRTVTIGWTWEDSPDGNVYEFDLTGTVSPCVPASMYGGPDQLGWPEEGGDVEIIRVRCTSIITETEDRPPEIDELIRADRLMFEAIENDARLREAIEYRMAEEAGEDANQ